MDLKDVNLFVLSLLLSLSNGFSVITVIDSLSGIITGSTTTYTVSSSMPMLSINSSGIVTDDNNTITLMFSDPVDLTISPHLTNKAAVFSNQSPNNTFVGDAGSWSFTPGTQTAGYNPNPWYVFTSSSSSMSNIITTDRIISGGGHSSGAPNAHEDWGAFTINGIQTLTWNIPDGSNRESYMFSAEISVPEPSGSVLLSFGILLLMARRKR